MNQAASLPRIEYRKILYATDLSESGRHAFPYAASIAHRYGAALTVFHVIETHHFEKYLTGYINEELWNDIRHRDLEEVRQILIDRKRQDAAIRDSLDNYCQDALPDAGQPYVTYDVVVEFGDPVEKIIEKAHAEAYDLVVLGKHGHGVLKGALMGDTAQRVMRRCHKPVLVVEVPVCDED